MNQKRRIRARGAAALAALALCAGGGSARADDVGNETLAQPAAAEQSQAAEQGEWAVVAETELLVRGTGGGVNMTFNAAELNSEVRGNQVGDYVTTGGVGFSGNAFSSLNGITQLTFNTGNNNSIQSNLFVVINLN